MQLGQVFKVRTDKDVDFTAAAAQNAMITADLINNSVGAGGNARSRIKSISILSDQNLAWEVNFFGDSNFMVNQANLDSVLFLGRWTFQVADGLQIAATGPYLYYVDGLDIPYLDADGATPPAHVGQIHVGLVNRSATAKNAGATGEIVLELGVEPTLTGA